MDQVHQILHAPCDADALLNVVAALKELGAAHAELDGEAGADRLPHRL